MLPASHMGDPNEALGSQLWTGPDLAIAIKWGMSPQMEDLCVHPSHSVTLCLEPINLKR